MPRALLVCPEPLGHQHPAGVGIRFLEFARALRAHGVEVTLLSPDGGSPDGHRGLTLSPQAIRDESSRSDVAIVQGHVANDFFAHAAAIPTVVDLYDPFIVENLHYSRSLGPQVYRHDHATLMLSVARGDLFLCASPAQRLFYLGLFLAAGRLNPDSYESSTLLQTLLRIVPFGVPPPRPVPEKKLENPRLLFGGIYDWYDPIVAIDAVVQARAELPGLTLTFNRHPNPDVTPQGAAARARQYVEENGFGEFVHFTPWVAYEERAAFYDGFAAALLTFPSSLETDLAMRTRLFDYLWAGLPVVTSSAPGTDDILRGHGAGAVVESMTASDYAAAVVRLLRDGEGYRSAVAGAQAWARENQWEKLTRPLVDFCLAPRVDAAKSHFAPQPATTAPHRGSLLERLRRRLGGTQ